MKIKNRLFHSVMVICFVVIGVVLCYSCSSYSSTTHITLDSLKVSNLDYQKTSNLDIKQPD